MRVVLFVSTVVCLSFLSCNQPTVRVNRETARITKIPVSPLRVYDLSGYAGSGGGHPYNLFDENSFVDPRYERATDAFVPVTGCQPTRHPSIYFRNGSRIVADLEANCGLREIWVYDHSLASDSFWIYTGDLKNWKLAAASVTVSQPGGWGWKKFMLDEISRFVMIRFSSYQSDLREMVLYGTLPENEYIRKPVPPEKGFTNTTLKDFLGVNYVMEKEARWIRPFHYSRVYNVASDFDTDTVNNPGEVRFNMLHYGRYVRERKKYVFDIDTLQGINNGVIWFSIRGPSKSMEKLGYTDKDRPVNVPGLDPELPASYSRHAAMMWHLSAFFGFAAVDTNLLSLSHSPRLSGRQSMHLFENGNEEDADWVGDKYCSPLEYYAQSTADWDGDEGKLGKRRGIHSADSRALLMMSGMTGLDTDRVNTCSFLSRNLRDDSSFIWKGGISYHHYAQKDSAGISPEDDSLRWKLRQVAEFTHRIEPGVPCILSENGYDKSPYSTQRTPKLNGYTVEESQGIMILRSINATFFSGFDAYILYWLRDLVPENDRRTYLTSGILGTGAGGKTIVYPGWYYISTLVNRLGNYKPYRIISESGGCWQYLYRHKDHPDSLALFFYQPFNQDASDQVLKLDGINSKVTIVRFDDHSETGTDSVVEVIGGEVRVRAEPMPGIVFYRQ